MHQQGYRNNYGLGTTTEHGNALRQEKIQIVLGCLYNEQALIEAYGAYVNTWCGLSKKEADVAVANKEKIRLQKLTSEKKKQEKWVEVRNKRKKRKEEKKKRNINIKEKEDMTGGMAYEIIGGRKVYGSNPRRPGPGTLI